MDHKLDLAFAQAAAAQMDDYIHAETLYYPLGMMSSAQMQPLTIGAWLETEWRLKASKTSETSEVSKTSEVSEVLAAAQTEVRRVRGLAKELYEAKARREFKSRLDTWALFLDEALVKLDTTRAIYAAQVPNRFKLELLQADVSPNQDQWLRLKTLDMGLRSKFKAGEFVWEPELKAAAPKDKYWWLWGAPV